jgi:tetratricopeptide (TPR) repeat protein
VRRARCAYCHALHLNPAAATAWGDLASALHQESAAVQQLQQQRQQPAAGSLATSTPAAAPPAASAQLSTQAEGLVKGGLLLQADSDWLWALLGCVAGDVGTAEYAFRRCLQLAPKQSLAWVLLGRLYARHGAGGGPLLCCCAASCSTMQLLLCFSAPALLSQWGHLVQSSTGTGWEHWLPTLLNSLLRCAQHLGHMPQATSIFDLALPAHSARNPAAGDLAQKCFDAARSLEPSLVAVWEAMGYLASGSERQQQEAFDSFEHAVGLGGGLESRLGFAIGALPCWCGRC